MKSSEFRLVRVSPKLSTLYLGRSNLLFWDGTPVAVFSAGVVYFHCAPGAQRRAVNGFAEGAAMIFLDPAAFDFTVGQSLTQAGLPLTVYQGHTDAKTADADSIV